MQIHFSRTIQTVLSISLLSLMFTGCGNAQLDETSSAYFSEQGQFEDDSAAADIPSEEAVDPTPAQLLREYLGEGYQLKHYAYFDLPETRMAGFRVKYEDQETGGSYTKTLAFSSYERSTRELTEQDFEDLTTREKALAKSRYGKLGKNGRLFLDTGNKGIFQAAVWLNVPNLQNEVAMANKREKRVVANEILKAEEEYLVAAVESTGVVITKQLSALAPILWVVGSREEILQLNELDEVDHIYISDDDISSFSRYLHSTQKSMVHAYQATHLDLVNASWADGCSAYCDGTDIHIGLLDAFNPTTEQMSFIYPSNVSIMTTSSCPTELEKTCEHAAGQMFYFRNVHSASGDDDSPDFAKFRAGVHLANIFQEPCYADWETCCQSNNDCADETSLSYCKINVLQQCAYDGTGSKFEDGLDWLVTENADIVDTPMGFENTCAGTGYTCEPDYDPSIQSRMMDYYTKFYGITFIVSNGNEAQICPGGSEQCWVSGQKSYNTIKVGATYGHNNTTTPYESDKTRSISRFVWQNPDTGDRELPDIAAPTAEKIFSYNGNTLQLSGGTSFAAPTLTGIAASVVEKDRPHLQNNPVSIKAILMASAIDDVDGLPSPYTPWRARTRIIGGLAPDSTMYDRRGGVGGVDANSALTIAGEFTSLPNVTASQQGFWHESIDTSMFNGTLYNKSVNVQADGNKRRLRVVLAWNAITSNASGNWALSELADLDLKLCQVNGMLCLNVASSETLANNWEFIEYTLPDAGTYRIMVYKQDGATVSSTEMAIAWYIYENDEDNADDDGDGIANYADYTRSFPSVNSSLSSAKIFPNADFEIGDYTGWTAYSATDTTTGIKNPQKLQSYWRFGESTSASVADKMGNMSMTVQGQDTTGFPLPIERATRTTTDYTTGATVSGLFYDGQNQRYLTASADNNDYDYYDQPFSIEVLFDVRSLPQSGSTETIIAKHSEEIGQNGWYVNLQSSGHVCFEPAISGSVLCGAINLGLNHLVITKKQNRLDMYLNGTKVYFTQGYWVAPTINDNTTPLSIGAHRNTNGEYDYFFKGSMLFIRLYGEDLSQVEAKQLWTILDQERVGFYRHMNMGFETVPYGPIVFEDMVHCRDNTKTANLQGNYWFSTMYNFWATNDNTSPCGTGDFEYADAPIQGADNTGYLQSAILEKPSNASYIGALIGGTGGSPTDVYIEIAGCQMGAPPFYRFSCNSWGNASNLKLKRAVATSDEMEFNYVSLATFAYDYLRIRIYDGSETEYINVDSIEYICEGTLSNQRYCFCGHDRTCDN